MNTPLKEDLTKSLYDVIDKYTQRVSEITIIFPKDVEQESLRIIIRALDHYYYSHLDGCVRNLETGGTTMLDSSK